jgi:uncharacterized glyoxalase superfamily protein PhnB
MESLSPNIFVYDMNQTIAFYKKLGFEVVMSVPEQGDFVWVMMSCGAVTVMFQTFDSLGSDLSEIKRGTGGPLLFYLKTKGIRNFFEQLQQQGVTILKRLEKTFYGATEFSIIDNNGFVLTFAEDE